MTFPDDQIHIASLELLVQIGVTAAERRLPQRLTISLTLRPRGGFVGLDDRIDNTINYSTVCRMLRELAAAASERRLLETFALEVADAVLAGFDTCASVDVDLRKYVLPNTDYVAVRLSRCRARVSDS